MPWLGLYSVFICDCTFCAESYLILPILSSSLSSRLYAHAPRILSIYALVLFVFPCFHGLLIAELGVWVEDVSSSFGVTSTVQACSCRSPLFIGLLYFLTINFFDDLDLEALRLLSTWSVLVWQLAVYKRLWLIEIEAVWRLTEINLLCLGEWGMEL